MDLTKLSFDLWYEAGLRNGFIGPIVCYTHDTLPMDEEEEQGIGQPVNPAGGEPQVTAEQYPPEDNTVEQGASESLTPMLDADVEKYSTILNRR